MKTPMTAMFTQSALPDATPATNEVTRFGAFTSILSGQIEILRSESAEGTNKSASDVQQPDPAMSNPWVLAAMGGLPVIPVMDKTGNLPASGPNSVTHNVSAPYPKGLTSLSTPQVELSAPSSDQALQSALASAAEPQASIPVKSRQLDASPPAMPEAQPTTSASPFSHPASATASIQPFGTREETNASISAPQRLAPEMAFSVAAQPNPNQPADSKTRSLSTDLADVTQLPSSKPANPSLNFRSMPQAESPVMRAESYSAARATLQLNADPQSRQSANSAVESVQTKTLGNLLASNEQPLLIEPAWSDRPPENFLAISTTTRNSTSAETAATAQPNTIIPLEQPPHQRPVVHAESNSISAEHFTAILPTLQQSAAPMLRNGVSPRAGFTDEGGVKLTTTLDPSERSDSITFPTLLNMTGSVGSTGPQTPSQPHLATPVHHPAWAQELNQTVTRMAVQDLQRAELHLNPTQLGPLDVVIEVKGDQATALFSSPHAVVREAVEQALPRLREMMAQNGIALGNATVSDQGARHSREGFSRKPSSGSTSSDKISANMSGVVGQPALPQTLTHRHTGLLDTFA